MKKIILSLTFLLFLTSCIETVVVGSAATAIVVTRQKNLKNTKNDVIIAAKIDKEFLVNGLKTPRNSVAVMVSEGRVLLTGTIRDLEKGKKATEIVWKTKGVKELIDEVEIDEKGLKVRDFGGGVYDSLITAKIKTKLFFNREVVAADFKINTSSGVVYILGIAKNNAQLTETLRVVSKTVGVKRVVNHAILVNDTRRNG